MTRVTPMVRVERVLPLGAEAAQLTSEEVDAILEATYLASASDGKLSDEEYEAFRAVASTLRHVAAGGRGVPPLLADKDIDGLFDAYTGRSEHTEREDRVRAVGDRLARTHARELAYKVAFAMALCDLEANDEEAAYDDELMSCFGIDEERADALAGEVYAALDADLDRDSEAPRR